MLCFAPVNSQKFYIQPVNYPKGYFRNPLDIPIKLAANFGELRTNHFHMGFDIRTNQRENLPVYAAAGGYISKVKIEKGGFGRAIYITHPNGYTTLYAHLNNFYPALHEFVVNKQYEDKKWEQEMTLTPQQFPVAKGDFIAYSGNTGGSAGPHLHFEIRDTKTGNNLNPWLFDMGLPDNIPPVIYRLYYYDRQYSTYENSPQGIALKGSSGKYTTSGSVVTLPTPYVSFGITAEDKTTPSSFNFGIYEASISIDDTLRSSFRLNDFSYDETRYLNASIDYKTRLGGGSYIQHLCRLPGNKSSVFSKGENGAYFIKDTGIHEASIDVIDAEGNATNLHFNFRYDKSKQKPYKTTEQSVICSPNIENLYVAENIVAAFSTNAFYDTVHLVHTEEKSVETGAISPVHNLQNYQVPVHDSFSVRIQPSVALNSLQKERVVIKLVSHKKKVVTKGIWKNNWMEAKFRDLGIYTLLLDTIPPTISPLGWVNGGYIGSRKSFALIVKDNLENIKKVDGFVDGKWILFSKRDNMITHTFDGRITQGMHDLKIIATDEAGNETEKIFTFSR